MPTLWLAFGDTRRVRSSNEGATGEPPPPTVLTVERSYLPTSGWFTMRCSTVSVNDQPVHRSRSMICITIAGSNRPISQTLLIPAAIIITAPACRPETWNSGLEMSWHGGSGGSPDCDVPDSDASAPAAAAALNI